MFVNTEVCKHSRRRQFPVLLKFGTLCRDRLISANRPSVKLSCLRNLFTVWILSLITLFYSIFYSIILYSI